MSDRLPQLIAYLRPLIDEDWRSRAACRDSHTPDLWHHPKAASTDTRRAKLVCNGSDTLPGCPVRSECLQWALAHRQAQGVWGGLDSDQLREQIRHLPPRRTIGA